MHASKDEDTWTAWQAMATHEQLQERMLQDLARSHGVSVEAERARWFDQETR